MEAYTRMADEEVREMRYYEIYYDIEIADDTSEPILQELEKEFVQLDDDVETLVKKRVTEVAEKHGIVLEVERVA
jgi:hypothetical protein